MGDAGGYSNVQVGGSVPQYMDFGGVSSLPAAANPLAIPQGKAIAMPSVRINDDKVKYERKMYGGKGDKPHLGGFATGSVDIDGMSPGLWKWMVQHIGVKSLLDVRVFLKCIVMREKSRVLKCAFVSQDWMREGRFYKLVSFAWSQDTMCRGKSRRNRAVTATFRDRGRARF